MSDPVGAANSTWCSDCQKHKSVCTCNPKENIYVVAYRLVIAGNMSPRWCEETVRCIACDQWLAMSKVSAWALTTEVVWWNENDEVVEHRVPYGARDVTIRGVRMYAADVGELLRQCPLPEIFPHEE